MLKEEIAQCSRLDRRSFDLLGSASDPYIRQVYADMCGFNITVLVLPLTSVFRHANRIFANDRLKIVTT